MKKNILLMLAHLPHDPTSGAARSVRTIMEMLAQSGFSVRSIATTATERPLPCMVKDYLAKLQITPYEHPLHHQERDLCPVLEFSDAKVSYTLLDVGSKHILEWERFYSKQFQELLYRDLATQRPDVILTYGGTPGDFARRKWLKEQGCAVVFALRNLKYLAPGALSFTDKLLASTQFVADQYWKSLKLRVDVLPLPIDPKDVVAPGHSFKYITMVNPSRSKGAAFMVRLIAEITAAQPDILFQIVESRGTKDTIFDSAKADGLDLERYSNVRILAPTPYPKDIFAETKLVLMPSVWLEPAGRVAVEAMLNGIPPLVSNRGGLPEVVGDAAFVLPLPAHITTELKSPASIEDVACWRDRIISLWNDPSIYQQMVAKSRQRALFYEYDAVAKQYADYFSNI